MKTTKINPEEKLDTEVESTKGTIISVTFVGAVIFVTYLVLYGFYMARI